MSHCKPCCRNRSSYGWAILEVLEPRVLLSAVRAIRARPVVTHPVLHEHGPHIHPITIIRKVTQASSTTPPSSAFTPAQLRHAYGFDQVSFGSVAGDGTGQTIAIIDAYDDPTATADLHAFDLQFGLPDPPSFQRVAQDGSTNYPPTDPAGAGSSSGTWEMEESLDIEWAHAMAPGAKILLVEAFDSSLSSLVNGAVGWARTQPNVSVVSMSFGQGEVASQTSIDSLFTTPSGHNGITFLASSGDVGSPPEYPSSSPNVVAVGGTTLTLGANGDYSSESAWSSTSNNVNFSSGGGVSTRELQPSYQKGIVTQSFTSRTTPDVSMVANPNTGVAIYDSYDFPSAPWLQIGGTSLSCPMWAGLIAVADQGRATQSLSTLDGPTQTLPDIYQLPGADFHDITTGASTGSPSYSAQTGYDLVTGRGSPIANKVIYGLMGAVSISGTVFQDKNSNGIKDGADSAFAGVAVYIDSNSNGVYDPGTVTSASNQTSTNIPDGRRFGNNTGLTSSVNISGTSGTVSNVSLTLNITHPQDSDLTAMLIAPDGTQMLLFIGQNGANFTNTTLVDQAANGITSASAPYTGTFHPTDALSDFNGKSANGVWSLQIIDTVFNGIVGTLQSWSLNVTTGAADVYATTTDSSGHYAFNNLPAGVSYQVREAAPAGYVQTLPAIGSSVPPIFTASTLNFSNFPTTLNAVGSNDSFYLAMDPTDTYLQISAGTTGISPSTYRVALTSLPQLTINLLGANSVLVVDYANGSPIPGGNLTVNMNAASNQELRILGQNPAQTFSVSDTALALNTGGGILYTNIPTLTVYNGTFDATADLNDIQNLNVNGGATFNF